MTTYTLISAIAGDSVPGVELAEAGDSGLISTFDLARLMDLPQVREFFDDNGYGPDNPDEVMYLVVGELESGRYPTLAVELAPTGTEQTEQVVVDDLYRITLDRGGMTVTVEVAAQDTPTGLTPVGYDHQLGWAERHGKEYANGHGYSLSGEWTQLSGRKVQAPIELDPLAAPGMKIRLTLDEDAPEEYYASLYWASGQVWDLGTVRNKVANYGDLRDGWKWLNGNDGTYYASPSEAVTARIGAMCAGLDLSTAKVVEW